MSSVVSIMRPITPTAVAGSMTDVARVATPDPKEVAVSTGAGVRTIDLDLGSEQVVGAVYIGGANMGTTFAVTGGGTGDAYTTIPLGNIYVAAKRRAVSPRQYLLIIDPPQPLRYIRLSATLANGNAVGIACALERFTPTWGQEWGAGRPLSDASSMAKNRAGGFGGELGVISPGYSFTLGDLTDDETEILFDIVRQVGESRPVVIVEQPDLTENLDARLHYGLIQRIEPYERQRLNIVRWGFRIEDWL